MSCRLHDKDQRISVGINDSILTEDTINEGIPTGHMHSGIQEREHTEPNFTY
jgi:hypothetical protein